MCCHKPIGRTVVLPRIEVRVLRVLRIEQLQLERINSLWKQAVSHVEYYRDLSQTRSIPQRFGSLREFSASVPILPKSKVRSSRNEFLSECPESGEWRYTGGSTGVPTAVFRSHVAHQKMLRSRYRFYQTWDVDIFDRWVFLWGHAASFAPGWAGFKHRLKIPVCDWLRRRIRLSAYNLGRDDLRSYLDRIAAFKPVAIYTYSKAGQLLAKEAPPGLAPYHSSVSCVSPRMSINSGTEACIR